MSFREGREACVLGEEAPARVDRRGAGLDGGLDDPLEVQIALGAARRAEDDPLASAQVGGVGVRLRHAEDGG